METYTPVLARTIQAGLFKGMTARQAIDLADKFYGAVWEQPAGRGYMEFELAELADELDGEAHDLLHS